MRLSGCQVLLKEARVIFATRKNLATAVHSLKRHLSCTPIRRRIVLLLSVVLVLVCCVPHMFSKPSLRGLVHLSLMSSQHGFSETQCGGQPAQAFDELSVAFSNELRIFGRSSMWIFWETTSGSVFVIQPLVWCSSRYGSRVNVFFMQCLCSHHTGRYSSRKISLSLLDFFTSTAVTSKLPTLFAWHGYRHRLVNALP